DWRSLSLCMISMWSALFFFFSSRRRHTRCYRDWSSDVCSSDLGGLVPASAETTWSRRFGDCKAKTALLLAILHEFGIEAEPVARSEERRVGKECRCRCGGDEVKRGGR